MWKGVELKSTIVNNLMNSLKEDGNLHHSLRDQYICIYNVYVCAYSVYVICIYMYM